MESTAAHQIGALSARVKLLEESHLRLESKIERRLDDLSGAVSDIHDVITSSKGMWRAMVILGSSIATMTAGIGAFFHWLSIK